MAVSSNLCVIYQFGWIKIRHIYIFSYYSVCLPNKHIEFVQFEQQYHVLQFLETLELRRIFPLDSYYMTLSFLQVELFAGIQHVIIHVVANGLVMPHLLDR